MIPKNIALAGPDRAALVLGPPIWGVVTVLRPVIVVINAIASAILRLLGVRLMDEVSSSYTREEVAALVEESRGEGLIKPEEYDRLAGALGFTEKPVSTVLMAPETLTTVRRGSTAADVEALCATTGYSRFPVEGDDGELLGYLHIKDVLETDEARRQRVIEDKWTRPFATVAADDLLHDALETLQRRGAHMARVVDSERRHAGRGNPGGRHRGAGRRDPRRGPSRVSTRLSAAAGIRCRSNTVAASPDPRAGQRVKSRAQLGADTTRDTRVWTVPNLLSGARLLGVPLFLWLVLGPEADGWALVVLMVSGATDYADGYLARKLNQTTVLGQILDPVADRLYILAVVVGLALRDVIPWWLAISLPLRDLLMWGLVPLLRTRGYSSLPVHFLGKAATFNLLYAFPLLLLGDGDGVVARLAEVFGWAFAFWGVGLYWWAGILYAWQVYKLLATTEPRKATAGEPECPSDHDDPGAPAPAARPGDDAAAGPGHPGGGRRGLRPRGPAPGRRGARCGPPSHRHAAARCGGGDGAVRAADRAGGRADRAQRRTSGRPAGTR